MTRTERKAFLALVHATCDFMTSGGQGACTRGSKRHTACNALNCRAYAIVLEQREKLLQVQHSDAQT
jgi:hypothetical protein